MRPTYWCRVFAVDGIDMKGWKIVRSVERHDR